jgi:hypothetical protein
MPALRLCRLSRNEGQEGLTSHPTPNRRWAHRFDLDPGLRSAHLRLKKVNV